MMISESDGKPHIGCRCRICGDTKLIETMADVTVSSECRLTDDGVEYDEQTNEDGHVIGYQCSNGHNVMTGHPLPHPVTTEEELIQLFGDEPILSHNDVVALIADRLRQVSGDELIEEYERAFPSPVLTYLGDSMYVLKERGQDADADKTH